MILCIAFHLRPMIDNAFQWAQANGHLRTNSVHKQQEAHLVLNEEFELLDESENTMNLEGTMEIQASQNSTTRPFYHALYVS